MSPSALNIEDLRRLAKRRLTRGLFEFCDRGSEDDVALRHNRDALERIKLRSRVLNDTSSRHTKSKLFCKPVDMPLVIGPTGPAGFVWYRGETALARAAAKAGIPFTVASTSNTPMEQIVEKGGGGRLWYHLYVWRDMEVSLKAVPRAEAAGFEALVLTVDSTVPYNREFDVRNGTTMPVRLTPQNIADLITHPRWLFGTIGRYVLADGHLPRYVNIDMPNGLSSADARDFLFKNDTLDWDFLKRIRDMWSRKLVVKGILHADDAAKCAECGVDAVVISNHGGIASDSALAPIAVLPSVVREVGDRMTVIVDSGFRRGSDILKGLALGADAVIVGRATLYGVSAAGEPGATRALEILQAEMHRTMGVMGLTRIADITRDHVVLPHELPL
ncbi:MAG: alpha-hydroxy-acid oxidizing enzyme [Alphaproteobacteria bacterium]|nr:alpha-hydroxy-acid oxidizing enzyme [Alphaproteobacteria bacterium]HCP01126.1 alpha-hydroxy-acid oxidizing enzyme [Rhodospirillaceae bacterium]